jgi:hypothetical protein
MYKDQRMADPRGKSDVSNVLTIGLCTDRVESLFNCLDPAPIERRMIADDVEAYIFDRLSELPEKGLVSLRILLPANQVSCCSAVQSAFRLHFLTQVKNEKRSLHRHFSSGLMMLLKGVILALLLVVTTIAVASLSDSVVFSKIAGVVSIMVWVILWGPLDSLIYQWHPIRIRLQMLERLAAVEVVCETVAPDHG